MDEGEDAAVLMDGGMDMDVDVDDGDGAISALPSPCFLFLLVWPNVIESERDPWY